MLKIFSKKWAGEKGFTLIELLVVIAIIGVLASIVLASLNNARTKARDTRRITDIKQIQLALELYFDGFGAGKYPDPNPTATPKCTAVLPAVPTADENHGLQVLQINGYIPVVPRDPNRTGNDLCYLYAAPAATNNTTYHLGATLEGANAALGSDKDCTSLGAGCGAAVYISGFDGTAAQVYDVIP